MVSESFSSGDTFLHHLDPRIKIISTLLFSIIAALADKPVVLALAFSFAVVLVSLARLDFKKLVARLIVVNAFVAFLWLFLPFSTAGETLFALGPLTATREGIFYALTITIKSNTIILATIALLGTSTIFDMVHALSHLKVPDKLVHLFFFSFRYFHVLKLELDRLRNAVKIRNFKPGTNIHTYKTYAYLVGMLLVNSYDRSQRIYQAMLCRGFHGKYHILDHFALRRGDIAAFAAILIFVAGLVFIQWGKTIIS